MKLRAGKPHIIVQGIRPEEGQWGPYQFPAIYKTESSIAVSVHVGEDSIKHYGDSRIWFESKDKGETWTPTDSSVIEDCGLKLPNGEKIVFLRTNAKDLSDYYIPHPTLLTPGTDMTKKAEEGTLPLQDGMTHWMGGTTIRAYLAERLPNSLSQKKWHVRRKLVTGEVREEECDLVWPYLTRVVFTDGNFEHPCMKGIYPNGVPKIGPDGAIWVTAFSGEGHINPKNGQYSPYYSAELFRSTDFGHTFVQHAHMEYPADGDRYPYDCGGFSDNEIAFFDDGSMAWFFRSAWYASTGHESSPMYIARSYDMGKTWTMPEVFSFTGIFPSLCRLNCGATLVCYARPGMYVTGCPSDDCSRFCEPLELMTRGDRSGLANLPPEEARKTFHDWDGADNNAILFALDDNSALIFNVDFYYPDEQGVKRKTVFCQKITVEMDETDSKQKGLKA